MKLQLILASVLFVWVTSCKKEMATTAENTQAQLPTAAKAKASKTNFFKGPEVTMGNGKARSVIELDKTGKPVALTIEMTNAALMGLPEEETEFLLPLHSKAKEATPFDHITVNWNPHGHEPEHVYDRPHFDFHFYKMSIQDRLAIPLFNDITAALFDNFPPAGYIPPTYIPIPGGVPQMGKHWVDVTAPELNGQPFTKTFIYGSYNGQVTFFEPMATLALIQSKAVSQNAIPAPQFYAPTNTYYPTVYRIDADESNHYVSLTEFMWR